MADHPKCATKAGPERAYSAHQETFFCNLYVDDNAFARVNSATMVAIVAEARGRVPRQQAEQRPIY
eukprot:11156631-Lingulodinium_polyedra.AAC.1